MTFTQEYIKPHQSAIVQNCCFEDTQQRLTQKNLLDRIVEAGHQPVERDSLYNVVADAETLVAADRGSSQSELERQASGKDG